MLSILNSEDGILEGDLQTSYDEINNELARRNHGKRRLIDYILIRNPLCIQTVSRSIVVYKGLKNNTAFDLSDHYGIEARVEFI